MSRKGSEFTTINTGSAVASPHASLAGTARSAEVLQPASAKARTAVAQAQGRGAEEGAAGLCAQRLQGHFQRGQGRSRVSLGAGVAAERDTNARGRGGLWLLFWERSLFGFINRETTLFASMQGPASAGQALEAPGRGDREAQPGPPLIEHAAEAHDGLCGEPRRRGPSACPGRRDAALYVDAASSPIRRCTLQATPA